MTHGIPLTDSDRAPWLTAVKGEIDGIIAADGHAVVACSALKKRYRDRLKPDRGNMLLVYLKGDFECIEQRMRERKGHFMRSELLRSQFADLEAPEDAITVPITRSPEEIVAFIEKEMAGGGSWET